MTYKEMSQKLTKAGFKTPDTQIEWDHLCRVLGHDPIEKTKEEIVKYALVFRDRIKMEAIIKRQIELEMIEDDDPRTITSEG